MAELGKMWKKSGHAAGKGVVGGSEGGMFIKRKAGRKSKKQVRGKGVVGGKMKRVRGKGIISDALGAFGLGMPEGSGVAGGDVDGKGVISDTLGAFGLGVHKKGRGRPAKGKGVAGGDVTGGGILSSALGAFGVLGAIDAFSGITATLGFWLLQIILGNITSVSDLLIILSVSIAWITPALFANLLREAVDKQVSELGGKGSLRAGRLLGIGASAMFGGLLFYFGQVLLNSVLINFTQSRNISVLAVAIISLAILFKGILDEAVVVGREDQSGSSEKFPIQMTIARVTSPQLAIGVLIAAFSFSYIWTKSAQQSIISALLFSAPYFLIFVRIKWAKIGSIVTARKFILAEPFLVAGITFFIYNQVAAVPLFADRRAEIFLILSALPGALHGLYGLICDAVEQQESEVIKI